MRLLLAFILFLSTVLAQRIEYYDDWRPDAAGEGCFASQGGLYYLIRKGLEENGLSVRHWDRKAHLPWLLRWKSVKSWEDFKHWLGFDLPRREVLEEDTLYLVITGIGLSLKDLALEKIPQKKLIFFSWEPPTVDPRSWEPKLLNLFHKVYTWDDSLVDNKRFFKFHLPYMAKRLDELVPYEERKFLTLIASRMQSKHPNDLYAEREKLIRFFEAHPEFEFDLYGRFWEKREFSCWRGTIPDKMAVLKQYRFAIAYENCYKEGYITEKLWDCLAAGVVPIYWGASNIEEVLPKDCFLDRRQFKDDLELVTFLEKMSKEEWEGYVERGGRFLLSETAKKFTVEAYAQSVVEAVSTL